MEGELKFPKEPDQTKIDGQIKTKDPQLFDAYSRMFLFFQRNPKLRNTPTIENARRVAKQMKDDEIKQITIEATQEHWRLKPSIYQAIMEEVENRKLF